MDEEEPTFKTAHNNPEEAAKFVTNRTILVEDFMIDINGYDWYKQEDAYPEFVRKYVKELKTLDDYFKDASTKTVLDLIDNKLGNYIRKPPPDPKAIKIRTSEENIPSGHHTLQQLAHEQPSPALDDAGQPPEVIVCCFPSGLLSFLGLGFTVLAFFCVLSAFVDLQPRSYFRPVMAS